MRVLLDTHVVIWQMEGSRRVGADAAAGIRESSEVFFSVVSFAEIGIKASIGKLTVPDGLREHLVQNGVRILGLSADHGLGVAKLPMHHRDPFDRLLIAQAVEEGLTLLTADQRIARYEVGRIDARR